MDHSFKAGEPFHFANPPAKGFSNLWDEGNPARHTIAERLYRLKQVLEGEWVDFYLVAATPKDVAIEAGFQLAYS